jgi:hypothetical protein
MSYWESSKACVHPQYFIGALTMLAAAEPLSVWPKIVADAPQKNCEHEWKDDKRKTECWDEIKIEISLYDERFEWHCR